ncbi:SMP-30/gluconolactonase/LRE family protein [Dasania sp. GY-MA-18]|uniref:SMP-30/gluconolactonase/LRE family protein n=1 Tax=Dasania phycosphaerae TaxID=2950436 RepID=A0A9J6RP17_9GAMM|nr:MULTISPECIES: SMP-30/gluconolactonase/LRE family protein [Dasania]MCR8923857.1 SMP-30/gluconolactonase/LRE family protein [Dasania sp. GY-MA-18]MCZ0866291.1 SMP-30/gluconolactonase/LRE family protein [Dasania phycosphaerae]MCZ0870015.1 SMP-30/gluconolactonase/LRE family protein [Dasania phycosphaerae]
MFKLLALIVFALILYLLTWPVAIEPKAWQAPTAPGYRGAYRSNQQLAKLELLAIAGEQRPEAVTIGPDGYIYASTHSGWIVRLNPQGQQALRWVNTQGRPLGLAFDPQGRLIVADAYRGLLAITPNKTITVLSTHAAGKAIAYANDVAVARDGRIFFSDASSKFSALAHGGTYLASLLDLMEHGGHGRLLKYNPAEQSTIELAGGFNFANGVALDPNEQFVLINETGHYRVLKHWLQGPKQGSTEVLIANLPGFPDNIAAGLDGRFWLGLASPRNALLDKLADQPWLRSVVQRLPAFMRPQAVAYGHVLAISGEGEVLYNLQDPSGSYPVTTGVAETAEHLYVSSLMAAKLGRLNKANL